MKTFSVFNYFSQTKLKFGRSPPQPPILYPLGSWKRFFGYFFTKINFFEKKYAKIDSIIRCVSIKYCWKFFFEICYNKIAQIWYLGTLKSRFSMKNRLFGKKMSISTNEWLLSPELWLKIIPWTATVLDLWGSQVFFSYVGGQEVKSVLWILERFE